MMCYTAFVTFVLFGVVTAQSSLKLSSCLTKEQNLRLFCTFVPVPDPKIQKTCYYMTENKLIGSTNASSSPDPTFKNRTSVNITNDKCELFLKGFSEDKPKNYTCFIRQAASLSSAYQTLDKSKLQACSAWCVLQHSGAMLLLAFLTFPLVSELL